MTKYNLIVDNDQDDRLLTLLEAMSQNDQLPFQTLGLWHELKKTTTVESTHKLMNSFKKLLKTSKITNVSVQNQHMETSHLHTWSDIVSNLHTLSIKVTNMKDDANDNIKEERDESMAQLFSTLGSSTSQMKSLVIEPDHLLGSIGVGPKSSSSLSNGLMRNPGKTSLILLFLFILM